MNKSFIFDYFFFTFELIKCTTLNFKVHAMYIISLKNLLGSIFCTLNSRLVHFMKIGPIDNTLITCEETEREKEREIEKRENERK